jgi:23S rRNA (guanosine2251-2'-O)-methyltransferase
MERRPAGTGFGVYREPRSGGAASAHRSHATWDRFDEPRAVSDGTREGLVGEDEEVVAGRRPVEEAFAARREAHRLLVVPERRPALEAVVLHAATLRIPVVEVEGGTLTALCGFDGHQGVALVVAPRRWASIDEVLARARERAEPPFILVLDSLEDPQNLGTMLRSAEACGVHGVLFPTRGQAPLSPAAVKASAGAVEHLLMAPVDDLAGTLVELSGLGIRRVGADEEAALSYREADLRGPIALVVGSEGHGIAGSIRRRLDLSVRIPMYGRVASLNASVAGSILLFEVAGQRGAAAEAAATGTVDGVAGSVAAADGPGAELQDAAGVAKLDAARPEPLDAARPEPLDASRPERLDASQPDAARPQPLEAARPEAPEATAAQPSLPAPTALRPRRRRVASGAQPGDAGEPGAADASRGHADTVARMPRARGRKAAPEGSTGGAAPADERASDDDLLPGEGPPPSGSDDG